MSDAPNPPAQNDAESAPAPDSQNGHDAPPMSAAPHIDPSCPPATGPADPAQAPHDAANPVLPPPEESPAQQALAAEPATDKERAAVAAHPAPHPASASKTAKTPTPKTRQPAAIDISDAITDAAITRRMEAKYGPALIADMNDAQVLLSYVTRNGLQEERKLSDETIQSVIASRHRLRTGEFDCETEEGPFRKNFGYLARAALPVSVASLRDSLPTPPQKRWFFFTESEPRSAAERTCFKYRNYAMSVLILLLVSQIYWTIASSVVSKSDKLMGEILKSPTLAEYAAAETEKTAHKPAPAPGAKPSTPDPSSTLAKVEKAPLTFDEVKSKSAELQTHYSMLATLMTPFTKMLVGQGSSGLIDLENNNIDLNLKVATLQSKVNDLNDQIASSSTGPDKSTGADKARALAASTKKALAAASEIAANLPHNGATSNNHAVQDAAEAPVAGFSPPGDSASSDNPSTQDSDKLDPVAAGPPPNGATNDAVRAVAGQVIDVMQKWFLPLLYGALGAMVYVVRTLSIQARDRLYRKEALVALNLRVYLGMISGLAIGWFWNHDSTSISQTGVVSITALSPFALAFVAGYGVELFFTLLDKIVSAFTTAKA